MLLGGGQATLRIAGLIGIYLFCGGVLISLALGLVIDAYDHRAKSSTRYDRRLSVSEHTVSPRFVLKSRVDKSMFSTKKYVLLVLCAVFALAFGILGVFTSSMERKVPGAIPILINDTINVVFTRQYSVFSLAETTGARGNTLIRLLIVEHALIYRGGGLLSHGCIHSLLHCWTAVEVRSSWLTIRL